MTYSFPGDLDSSEVGPIMTLVLIIGALPF